jgi:hypothetical protein
MKTFINFGSMLLHITNDNQLMEKNELIFVKIKFH